MAEQGKSPKKLLVSGIKERQHQAELREQYGVTDSSVKVVEKKSTGAQVLKVLLASGGAVVRCVATLALVVLAVIGLATIIYPDMRAAGLAQWAQITAQLVAYLPH